MPMKWSTEVIPEIKNYWSHDIKIMTMGSCFATNIADKLSYYLFDVFSNPFGISFNPLSIAKQLHQLQSTSVFNENEIRKEGDSYYHFDFHSQFSSLEKSETATHIETSCQQGKNHLASAEVLMLTFGSAFYYEHETYGIVNNCHKLPNQYFTKKRASLNDMFEGLKQPLEKWLAAKSNREVIVTVSPVRHWKDGVIENARSKASLLLLAEKLTEWDKRISYFPAYEIMMDELRDYRFYDEDMLHPSKLAIDFIWNKFSTQRLEPLQVLFGDIAKIQQAINHRPFQASSKSHQLFLNKTLQLIEKLKNKGVKSTDELADALKSQILEK